MRMRPGALVAIIVGTAVALMVSGAFGADEKTPADKGKAQPKSRADWPVERVLVIGKRGNLRDWISNQTVRGTEGFADGSAPPGVETRSEYPWQVYYAPDGTLEARFRRLAARTPHGPIEELDFVEKGTWRITGDGDLCQTIPRVGYGIEVCFYMDRRGDRIAFYFSNQCGAYNRCYPGRLGPEGEIVPGRQFTR